MHSYMGIRLSFLSACVLLLAWYAPAGATVKIGALKPSLASPQQIGATVAWTATATDTNAGPVTFQFNVAPPRGALATAINFNAGKLTLGTWKSNSFAWALTGIDGTYQVQVVATDFTTGESASKTASFVVTSPIIGSTPVVQKTQNTLVALFTAPPCAAGSTVRVSFQQQSGSGTTTTTYWSPCQAPAAVSFEIAGMYPSTTYSLFAQVETGGKIVNGPTVSFTTGALPSGVTFPSFQVSIPDSPSDPNQAILHGLFNVDAGTAYAAVATDLAGKIIWYNYPNNQGHESMMTRPLPTGFLAEQNGPSWNPNVQQYQVLRQFDWAGNIVRETNIGIVEQQLTAMGNPDAKACSAIPSPPPVGSACLGIFNHEAVQTLPNGYTAAIVDVEKIFPPGTQGDTSGLPVDICGDIIVVLDRNWNVAWYWDAFDPAGGSNGYPQMPVSRTAVLNEECASGHSGCLSLFLLGKGVAPAVHDWLHGNTVYYWPHDGAGTGPGDLLYSSRHQDWVLKISYQDGAGNGNILWRMGPSGDYAFVNQYNDPWPWFSHQHEIGIENGGTGVFDLMDNGNTRLSPPSGAGSSTGGVPGLGTSGCAPHDCHSRGMALTFSESNMQVNPALSVDLGTYSSAMGSAQLLGTGNYYFLSAVVINSKGETGYDIQIQPTAGTDSGVPVMNMSGPPAYRSWQMTNLYNPPAM